MKLLLAVLITFQVVSFADDKRYTMADLEALAAQKGYSELLQHAADIPPAARDKKWAGLVDQAAIAYMTSPDAPNEEAGKGLLKEFPHLKNNKEFMATFASSGADSVEKCFEKGYQEHECTLRAIRLVKSDPSNTDMAFKIGKLIAKNFSAAEALNAFHYAITKENQDKLCQDGHVQRAIVDGMRVPQGDLVKEARTLASDHCFNEVKATLEKAVDNEGGGIVKNACQLLKAKGTLKGLRNTRCERALKEKES